MDERKSFWRRLGSLNLSQQIAIALLFGIFLGLFFGEAIAPISAIADGYILLLQMAVLPYITVSIVAGLGSLKPEQAKLVFSKVGLMLMLIWAITLVFVFAMPFSFPQWESASFFSTSLIEKRESFDFLNLYIPSNPFHALANNIVPGVVLFSVILGIAVIRVEKKERLISFLEVVTKALAEVNRFVVRLSPIGLFAIGANLAGTLRLEELERVQVYILAYGAFTILLTFWALPALVSALTPISYREILGLTRNAIIAAFMTGSLFVVLPILSEACKKLLVQHSPTNKDEAASLADVIVPVSFNFPHSGKVLSISFILFAAWFSDVVLSPADYGKLGILGLLSYFGSVTAAVPYLLDLFRIPIDTFQLFLATGIVNSRFGSAAAAMHTFVLAVLGSCALSGLLVIKPIKILRYTVTTLGFAVVLLIGLRFYFVQVIHPTYTKAEVLKNMELRTKRLHTPIKPVPDQLIKVSPSLERIIKRGKLQVGYLTDSLPYVYSNSRGELIGFDIDMARQLAAEIGVSLEHVPIDRNQLIQQINQGRCDILMSGFASTTDRAKELLLSSSYVDEHLAFLVMDHRRNDFLSRKIIMSHPGLRIGVPNVPYYIEKLRDYAPNSQIVLIDSLAKTFENSLNGLDAVAITAERGSAWCLLHPQYSAVVPQPDVLTIPMTYAVALNNQDLVLFLNSWLELKNKDHTLQQLYDYWILGKNAEKVTRRWSIVRDVLHWSK